jgi:hypothetical protein
LSEYTPEELRAAFLLLMVRSLRSEYKMNAVKWLIVYVRTFQLENRWEDFDQIWYRHCAGGGHPN